MNVHDEADGYARRLLWLGKWLGVDVSGIVASGKAKDFLDDFIDRIRSNLPPMEAVGLPVDTARLLGVERESADVEETVVDGKCDEDIPFHDEPLV